MTTAQMPHSSGSLLEQDPPDPHATRRTRSSSHRARLGGLSARLLRLRLGQGLDHGRAAMVAVGGAAALLGLARLTGSHTPLLRIAVAVLIGVAMQQAYRAVRARMAQITRRQWTVAALGAVVIIAASTSDQGIHVARLALTGGLAATVWLRWVMPNAWLLRPVTMNTPMLMLLIGLLIGSAEPAQEVSSLVSSVSDVTSRHAPEVTAGIWQGVTTTLGTAIRALIRWLLEGA